jgi:5-(carboxyamino)imidazole ribonucleotide synthase
MGYAADRMGTLGILGGGQLAQMTALAARALGYRVHALNPEPQCPAAPVVDRLVVAPYHDERAAQSLALGCDVVTLDIEHVPASVLHAISSQVPVRPGALAMEIIQDRGRQKQWLRQQGFPVGPFRVAEGERELESALLALGATVFVKAAGGGFDGRGQCLAYPLSKPERVLAEVGATRVTVELALQFKAELSVMVARRPDGATVVYPPALNHHEQGVLAFSLLPAPLPAEVLSEAQTLAEAIAHRLGIVGLCCVELFLLPDDSLAVNEIAPRPHNSYHGSERAVETSQFEQHVRAVFDLPFGPVGVVRPTAMANLLGDLWLGGTPPNMKRALAVPGVRVQLYGKPARKGRKLGHLSAIGGSVDEALERVMLAKRELGEAGDGKRVEASAE